MTMVGCGRAQGFEMNPVYTYLPYVGRKVSQCPCGWLISTAIAASILLTVSSMLMMVSVARMMACAWSSIKLMLYTAR